MFFGLCVVEYVEHMGSDLSVVNAARASFGRESYWETGPNGERRLRDEDRRLIAFLARGYRSDEWDRLIDEMLAIEDREAMRRALRVFRNKAQHWAPFAHPHVTLRLRMPIFAARQFVKHQVGGVWSEESRRYVKDEPVFWLPDDWHSRPDDIKQGSGGLIAEQDAATQIAKEALEVSLSAYMRLLALGVAPEEARIVLPLAHMTTVVWTGSLLFWARVVNQRSDAHAQRAATQEIARRIDEIMRDLFPVSWPELVPR